MTECTKEVEFMMGILELDSSFKADGITDSMVMGGIVDSIKVAQCKKTTVTEVSKNKNCKAVNAGEEMKLHSHRKRSGSRRGYPDDKNKKQHCTPSRGQQETANSPQDNS